MAHIVVITPAYNCLKTIRQTMLSVVGQSYTEWEMVIIDDVSTDGTGEYCQELATQFQVTDKVRIIRRDEKFGETRNTYDVCQMLDDDDIIIRLDGGDWLTDLGCFQILDSLYREHDNLAVLWTAHRWSFTAQNISGPLDPTVSPYKQPWRSSHLKTFKKSAMNDINVNNYLDDDGEWIMIACDQAVFLPMLEKAWREKKILAFLDACMYHYNIDTNNMPTLMAEPRSQHQKFSAEWIRKRGYIE